MRMQIVRENKTVIEPFQKEIVETGKTVRTLAMKKLSDDDSLIDKVITRKKAKRMYDQKLASELDLVKSDKNKATTKK